MVKTNALSPAEFVTRYPPLKARRLNQTQIAKKLKISDKTLRKYLKDEEYGGALNGDAVGELEKENVKAGIAKGGRLADEIITTSYKLHKQMMADELALYKEILSGDPDDERSLSDRRKDAKPHLEGARRLSIEALKVARTEAEVNRIYNLIIFNKTGIPLEDVVILILNLVNQCDPKCKKCRNNILNFVAAKVAKSVN